VDDTRVLSSPAVVSGSAGEIYTVNIPDSKGGFIPVKIKKSAIGYTGPQGEYYSEFPKVAQLQAMYVK
jgi:hypothetical protein